MQPDVAQQLIELNKRFYQKLASPFSATRGRLQPGVLRVLENVPGDAAVLDLGCGNGGVAKELIRRGHRGRYVGLDFSAELLEKAMANVPSPRSNVEFFQADLSSPEWEELVNKSKFDFIFTYAVLHHLPSHEVRLGFLKQVKSLISPDGKFVLSNWQFLNSLRLKARIQPWEKIGLSDKQIDEGDYLLDWRGGGEGLRYVHHFDRDELSALAAENGFRVSGEFEADGKSGNLALYQTWVKEGSNGEFPFPNYQKSGY